MILIPIFFCGVYDMIFVYLLFETLVYILLDSQAFVSFLFP